MALVSNVNVPTTTHGGAVVIWNLISTLVSAGWTLTDSNNASGGAVTDAASLNNANAWVLVTEPTTARQFVFSRLSNNYSWLIRYSRAGSFSGGGTGTPPTAADQQTLHNAALFPVTAGTYYAHAVADDTAQTATHDVYPFWFGASVVSTGAWSGGGIYAPINLGTPPTDQDPAIFSFAASNSWLDDSLWYKWTRYGLTSPTWSQHSRPGMGSFGATPDPYDRGIVSIPMIFFTTSTSIAGASNWIQHCPQGGLAMPDTRNIVSGPSFVFGAGTLLPWPVGVIPLV